MSKKKTWSDESLVTPEIMKLYDAEEMADEILEGYKRCGVHIKLEAVSYKTLCGDGFKFKIRRKKSNSSIAEIQKKLQEVQWRAGIPTLQILQEDGKYYLITYSRRSLLESLNNDLRQVFRCKEYHEAREKMKIVHPVGVDLTGKPILYDLAKYPHAMVCGTTTGGKTTALKSLLVSLSQYSPEKINLLIAGIGGAEWSMFDNLPHLSHPIIYDPEALANIFLHLETEMKKRIDLQSSDINRFKELPHIVLVSDEFAWFINNISDKIKQERVKKIINWILRYGRHNKIHLFLTIHDPKSDIAQIELGDFRVRLVFQTVSSRKALNAAGHGGSEKLNGEGEMFFEYINTTYNLLGFNIDDRDIETEIQSVIQKPCNLEYPRGEFGYSISEDDLVTLAAEFSENLLSSLSERNTPVKSDTAEQEYAVAVYYILSHSRVSVNFIQKNISKFGNFDRAKDLYQKLKEFEIIGGEEDRHGRLEVLTRSVEELPTDLKELLNRNGISDDKIAEAIEQRNSKK